MRRLLLLASAMIFFDVAFFAAIAPLLPEYVDDLGLSKAQAGILSASYAAGTLAAALPAGFVASRFGPRRTVIAGLLLLGVSSLVFGLVDEIDLLDAARFVQGVAGALIWSGALTWLIVSRARGEPRLGDRHRAGDRGRRGAARPGAGRRWRRRSAPARSSARSWSSPRCSPSAPRASPTSTWSNASRCARSGNDAEPAGPSSAAIFVAIPSVMFGAIEVLVPLRIDALGGGHGVIAAGFIAGAALEAILAPLAGRYSDRVGRRTPYVIGLSICAWRCSSSPWRRPLGGVLAALIVTSLGAGPLLRAGADPALRRRRGQQPAPGLRRRDLEHGLGLGRRCWAGSAAASSPASPATPLPASRSRPCSSPPSSTRCGRWSRASSRRPAEG